MLPSQSHFPPAEDSKACRFEKHSLLRVDVKQKAARCTWDARRRAALACVEFLLAQKRALDPRGNSHQGHLLLFSKTAAKDSPPSFRISPSTVDQFLLPWSYSSCFLHLRVHQTGFCFLEQQKANFWQSLKHLKGATRSALILPFFSLNVPSNMLPEVLVSSPFAIWVSFLWRYSCLSIFFLNYSSWP